MKWHYLSAVAFVGTLSISTSSHAQFVTYNSQATFLAAIMNPGVDTFAGFNTASETATPITRTAGVYGYIAFVTGVENFFGAGTVRNPSLSTSNSADAITFSDFTGGVGAVGGNFFTTNVDGAFESGDIIVTYTDASGARSTTLRAPTPSSFFGVVSLSRKISSLSVSAVQPANDFLFPAIDNLTLAQTIVPEPETYALLTTGLLGIGFAARRRRPLRPRSPRDERRYQTDSAG